MVSVKKMFILIKGVYYTVKKMSILKIGTLDYYQIFLMHL